MPIVKMTGQDAIATMKANAEATWPQRRGTTRVSPVAQPAFAPAFHLNPGDAVFTIGSCFARNVERALKARGFRLPALDMFDGNADFDGIGTEFLNNFGAPSIHNELAWAFAEDDVPDEVLYAQTGTGWVDLHLSNKSKPTDLDTLRQRRRAVRAAYRSIAQCRAVIITLGLSEVWFDTQTGYYLNMAPRRAMLRAQPDRFELHVLGYEETRDHLTRALELIRQHGAPGIQVLLTVSPIPLAATYRDQDVMVANTYSKSVLRAVAEELVQRHDDVAYYPSFESITLSPRPDVYTDDEIHVTTDIIDLNIDRMVQAYTGNGDALTEADALSKLDEYMSRPKRGFELLSNNISLCSNPKIADAYLYCALSVGRLDVAEAALPLAQDRSGILTALLHWEQGDPAGAIAAMKEVPEGRLMSRYYALRIRAFAALGQMARASVAARDWSAEAPNAPAPYKVLAEAMAKAGDDAAASAAYARAVKVSGGASALVLDYAELLAKRGKADLARQQLDGFQPGSEREERRKQKLLRAC